MNNELSEKTVTADCIAWLRSKGWICRRQHVGTFQPVSGGAMVVMGEGGEADWRCMRAADGQLIEYFELELKASNKKPRAEQLEYAAKRRYQGFRITWADSLNSLKTWYAEYYQ